MNKYKVLILGIAILCLLSLMIACSKEESNTSIESNTNVSNDNINESNDINESTVEFVDIPSDGENIPSFKLAKTEITNQQYVDYLNTAMSDGLISVVDESDTVRMIYDNEGHQMLNILGYRVIKDHDRNGTYELWEMENPLNRSMVDYDSTTKTFSVVDPSKVNWTI